jgi:hypothetical protein
MERKGLQQRREVPQVSEPAQAQAQAQEQEQEPAPEQVVRWGTSMPTLVVRRYLRNCRIRSRSRRRTKTKMQAEPMLKARST